MFSTIVVGIDGHQGGQDAVSLAKMLAGESSDIVLVAAFPYEIFPDRASIGGYAEIMRDETRAMLDAVADGDPLCRTRVIADGSPGRALHQVASEEHADLIVVGSAHNGRVGRILLGDVSRSTLHGAPCAVAVAPHGFREHSHDRIATIGVGFNSTKESEAALTAAADMAAKAGASLVLLTAATTPAAVTPSYAYAYDWTLIEAENRKVAEERLTDVKASLDVPVETRVVSGNAGLALEELSRDVDVIVAGSRGWGTVKAVVLGSTTDRLVHHAHCPVIVIPSPVAAPTAEEQVHA